MQTLLGRTTYIVALPVLEKLGQNAKFKMPVKVFFTAHYRLAFENICPYICTYIQDHTIQVSKDL